MSGYELPILTAFWLGILTSISPCPLATNICAVAYITKNMSSKKVTVLSALLYSLGRVFTYFVIGFILITALVSIMDIAYFLQNTINIVIGPILFLTGIFLLFAKRANFSVGSKYLSKLQERMAKKGIFGAFLLGSLFALAFCPITAALFFGSLIPLSLKYSAGITYPLVYGIGTGLPVIAFAILIALGVNWVSSLFNKISQVEKVIRIITAIIFLIIGVYFTLLFFGVNVL